MVRHLIGYGLGVSAMAFALVGCSSGTPPLTPANSPAAQTLRATTALRDRGERSWMAADAVRKDLLYVSDLDAGNVYVYSYPEGKHEGMLTGFQGPSSMCADSSGNVWVLDTHASKIIEFAHGGTKPIASLDDSYWSNDCAVDPKTGDLAVANVFTANGPPSLGNLMIFAKAKGKPKMLTDTGLVNEMYVAYDDKGNLFVDGFGPQSNNFALAELPSGQTKLTDLTLDQSIEDGQTADVTWDGKYLTVGDASTDSIYRFSISGTHGKKIGTTPLTNEASDFLAHYSTPLVNVKHGEATQVVSPNSTSVGFWNYPTGGNSRKSLNQTFIFASAAIVSSAR
jgi:hypothetical protein